MDLMTNCNLVARAKKGFHYLYEWDSKLPDDTYRKKSSKQKGPLDPKPKKRKLQKNKKKWRSAEACIALRTTPCGT